MAILVAVMPVRPIALPKKLCSYWLRELEQRKKQQKLFL
jgi:hypothetical protein